MYQAKLCIEQAEPAKIQAEIDLLRTRRVGVLVMAEWLRTIGHR